MKSHKYQFDLRGFVSVFGPFVGACIGFVVLLLVCGRFDILPKPRHQVSPDKTALFHQFELSRRHTDAEIVFVGDSSCMMGVDPLLLQDQINSQAKSINLGLIVGLTLGDYGQAALDHVTLNDHSVKTVVLLVSPSKLETQLSNPNFRQMWQRFADGGQQERGESFTSGFRRLVNEQLIAYMLPRPLTGSGSSAYGFTIGIRDYMQTHLGAAVDHGEFVWKSGRDHYSYQFSEALIEESKTFRSLIPRRIRLVAGLTPVPEALVGEGFRFQRDSILLEWNKSLGADLLLTNLPPKLPNGLFASPTHLNPRGQAYFTSKLAEALNRIE